MIRAKLSTLCRLPRACNDSLNPVLRQLLVIADATLKNHATIGHNQARAEHAAMPTLHPCTNLHVSTLQSTVSSSHGART
jgi:hypothetical protein